MWEKKIPSLTEKTTSVLLYDELNWNTWFFLFNDHYNKCLINYKYYILYCNYKVCIHTACFCWSISLDKASFHFVCETFTWLYIFWALSPFFPRSQCTTVSYNERTRIFTHPRPSSSTWRQKQHSICLHHNSQVNKCIFLCLFVLVKLWSARGGGDKDALLLVKPVSGIL